MSVRKGISTTLVLALLLTACSSGDDEASDTTAAPQTTESGPDTTQAPDTTEAAPTTTTTTLGPHPLEFDEFDASVYEPLLAEWECVYLDDYIAVGTPFEDLGGLVDALGVVGLTVEATSAETVLTAATAEGSVNEGYGLEEAAGESIDEHMGLLSVGDEDPLVVSQYLKDQKVAASPIHAVGLASHWAFKPGTDAVTTTAPIDQPIDDQGMPILLRDHPNPAFVAVIDSGFVESSLQWLERNGWVRYENQDIEATDADNPASHGTFVTSLIRQTSGTTAVRIASAHRVNTEHLVDAEGHVDDTDKQQYITTELHVADALHRIMNQESTLEALNLSLGTYTCDPAEDALVVTLTEALGEWFAHTGAAPVLAAAGNEKLKEVQPFWPAALGTHGPPSEDMWWDVTAKTPNPQEQAFKDGVLGVGAVDLSGLEVVWHDETTSTAGTPTEITDRDWVKFKVPGTDLISIGDAANQAFVWSGSSFATAVATGLIREGALQDAQVHGDVARLTYLDGNGDPVGPAVK